MKITTDSSPCIGLCSGGNVCRGCGRTQYEITHWGAFTEHQKIRTNARSASRRKRFLITRTGEE